MRGIYLGSLSGLFMLMIPLSVSAVALPNCVLSTPPGSIYAGQAARLIWVTENAQSGSIAGIGQVQIPQGHTDVYPTQNKTYTMTVTNAAGSRTCGALVTVVRGPTSLLWYNSPIFQTVTFAPVAWRPIALPTYISTRTYPSHVYVTDEWYPDSSRSRYGSSFDDHDNLTYGYSSSLEVPAPGEHFTHEEVLPDGTVEIYKDCRQGWSVAVCSDEPDEIITPDNTGGRAGDEYGKDYQGQSGGSDARVWSVSDYQEETPAVTNYRDVNYDNTGDAIESSGNSYTQGYYPPPSYQNAVDDSEGFNQNYVRPASDQTDDTSGGYEQI